MNSTEQFIYEFVAANPLCWTSDISNDTGLTQMHLRPILLKMVADGHLTFDKKFRVYKWKVNHC